MKNDLLILLFYELTSQRRQFRGFEKVAMENTLLGVTPVLFNEEWIKDIRSYL